MIQITLLLARFTIFFKLSETSSEWG